MVTRVGVGVVFDMSSCEGVEPVFVFDMDSGQFLVDVAQSEWLVKRDLEEQRISLATAARCLDRIQRLAWRMGKADGPKARSGPQLARTAPQPAARSAAA